MKTVEMNGIGEVLIKKFRRSRKMTIKINAEGTAIVTIPSSLPYFVGRQFAETNKDWILKNQTSLTVVKNGDLIGRLHSINFKLSTKLRSRVQNNLITVYYGPSFAINSSEVQKEAKNAITRAIKKEALATLPERLSELAAQHGYEFNKVSCKSLKTRWGSCSNEKNINLNIWLVQLPDELVDYVLIHELAHLNHPHHQALFWNEVSRIIPEYKIFRKELKNYIPSLMLNN